MITENQISYDPFLPNYCNSIDSEFSSLRTQKLPRLNKCFELPLQVGPLNFIFFSFFFSYREGFTVMKTPN